MDDITVLITGSGAPGIAGTLYSLKNNFDGRRVVTIGTDIKGDVIGRHLCDRFYKISRPSTKEYLHQLLHICEKEGVGVLLPQNTAELPVLAGHREEFESVGTVVAISGKKSIDVANDKHELMKKAVDTGVPVPGFYLVDNLDDLREHAEELGWPERPVVIKPPVSNGMRGLRIIDESIDLKHMFFAEKPSGVHMRMKDLGEILGQSFPSLLLMEYLEGEEYTVDALQTESTTIVPRKRELIKSGITFNGIVDKNEKVIDFSERLSHKIGLAYAFGFQFKLDKDGVPRLLESNPRIQGTMVLATFAGANVIYGAVKHALKEEVPKFDIKWGTRILRYWGGLGIDGGSVLGAL